MRLTGIEILAGGKIAENPRDFLPFAAFLPQMFQQRPAPAFSTKNGPDGHSDSPQSKPASNARDPHKHRTSATRAAPTPSSKKTISWPSLPDLTTRGFSQHGQIDMRNRHVQNPAVTNIPMPPAFGRIPADEADTPLGIVVFAAARPTELDIVELAGSALLEALAQHVIATRMAKGQSVLSRIAIRDERRPDTLPSEPELREPTTGTRIPTIGAQHKHRNGQVRVAGGTKHITGKIEQPPRNKRTAMRIKHEGIIAHPSPLDNR